MSIGGDYSVHNSYVSLMNAAWDPYTNIFTNVFTESVKHINPGAKFNPAALLADLTNILVYNIFIRCFTRFTLHTINTYDAGN